MADWEEDETATGLTEAESLVQPTGKVACFTVLVGDRVGTVFKLPRGPSLIGRISAAAVRLADDGLSRQHARLRLDADDLWIEDLGSRNGTHVNGERLRGAVQLRAGDKVQVGRNTVLRFGWHDALDESFHDGLMSSALRDPQTRLFNKRYLLDRLDSELKFVRRHGGHLSLLMIDVDHFKLVNDIHGHLAGDAVLANLAQVLLRAVRNEDVVARFGGEELAIILRATGIDQAMQLGERLRRIIEVAATPYQTKELRATVSVGVASYPETAAENPDQLVEAADAALYRAKHAGRNRVAT
ncbi:MAG TPA: GGDEF domain-containing protein [Kofleriaceae bacterium]